MPIYEFICKDCGNTTEQYFNVLETNQVLMGGRTPLCRNCCSKNMKLIMSVATGIVNGYNYKNGYSKGVQG
jgi:predicted nucleic acid-binding Zn ribbon protein